MSLESLQPLDAPIRRASGLHPFYGGDHYRRHLDEFVNDMRDLMKQCGLEGQRLGIVRLDGARAVRPWVRRRGGGEYLETRLFNSGVAWMESQIVPGRTENQVIGGASSPEERERWHKTQKGDYRGDEGRKRLRTCSINLRDRDGLHGRLDLITCPVLWMQGTADQVYSVPNAEDEIEMFVNSAGAELQIVDGGQHFLSASHPAEVNAATIDFVKKWTA